MRNITKKSEEAALEGEECERERLMRYVRKEER